MNVAMLGCYIITLAGTRINASMHFPPLRVMFKEALARIATRTF